MSLLAPGQRWHLAPGDCRAVLATMPAESVDAIVCDPPYELAFMGKKWDASGIAYDLTVWRECLRVLRPGGHLLAFGGTRTHHRVWCAIEDAGFEIRDTLTWLYGSGFPKSLDVSKAIEKFLGADRPRTVVPVKRSTLHGDRPWMNDPDYRLQSPDPATPESAQWKGWGTALKPATEPCVLARKPLTGTVAANVLTHGTGALNVDGCRVPAGENDYDHPGNSAPSSTGLCFGAMPNKERQRPPSQLGRFPANLLHDGSPEVLALFPAEAGGCAPGDELKPRGAGGIWSSTTGGSPAGTQHADSGSAARFFPAFPLTESDHAAAAADLAFLQRQFYCAKASMEDREAGLREAGLREAQGGCLEGAVDGTLGLYSKPSAPRRNIHPTVKPLALMRWICRLVTPPGGILLDPFTGSGSTGKAALLEGFRFFGIELNAGYLPIIEGRLTHATRERESEESRPVQLDLFGWEGIGPAPAAPSPPQEVAA